MTLSSHKNPWHLISNDVSQHAPKGNQFCVLLGRVVGVDFFCSQHVPQVLNVILLEPIWVGHYWE